MTALCRLDDIPDGGSAAFPVPAGIFGDAESVMAIRRGDEVFVYLNICPHWGSPLDIVPGRFLDRTGEFVVCTTHGALFRIENGLCVKGPCLGASLARVVVSVENGSVSIVD